MKLLKFIILGLGVIAAAPIFLSCKRETPHIINIANANDGATVQVFNATVKAAKNYVYVDGIPVSGSVLAYGGIFPASTYAFKVDAGSRTFLIKDTTPTTTQTPITFSQNLDAGKSYTIFTYDTITSVKQITVANNLQIPTDTTARLRFANFIYNTTPVAAVDVYSARRGNTILFGNVPTAQVTDFIPFASGITDTLSIYATGTTTPLIVKQVVNSLTPTRSYTTIYSGSYKGTKAFTIFSTY